MAEIVRALGIFGCPLGHSVSHLMYSTALKHLGINFQFQPYEVKPENLAAAVEGIRAMGIRGVSVTIPHKEAIAPLLDELSEDARLMGAVNLVCLEDGNRLVGHNTDGIGFVTSLRKDAGQDPKGKRVLLLGAGGAARAIAVKLAQEGAGHISILNRTPSRALELARHVATQVPGSDMEGGALEPIEVVRCAKEANIIINCTSVGMWKEGEPPEKLSLLPSELIMPNHLICDVVYNPLLTPLLCAAKRRKAKVLTGLGMIVYQGAEAFRRWTGCELPVQLVRRRLMRALSQARSQARAMWSLGACEKSC